MNESTTRANWTETTLGEVADVIMGRQLSPSKKMGVRPRRYLRAANIGHWGISLDDVLEMDFSETEEKHFASQVGDVLMVEGGNEKSVGCPAIVTSRESGLCIQNTVIRCRIKDASRLSAEYLFHFLRHSFWNGRFGELCAGTTIMHLGQKRAIIYPILFPPLSEQKRIVDVMTSVDAYITAIQQQAVQARIARYAVLHELLTAGGDDWTETKLGEVAAWHSGGTPKAGKPEFYEDGTIPWVVIADMLETEILSTASRITPAGLAEIGGKLAPKGSVLISMYATVGRPGFAHIPVATNQAIAWSIPNAEVIHSRFLLFVAQRLEPTISAMARGATQKNINRAILRDFSFMLPPLSEQKRIVETVTAMDDVVSTTEQAVRVAQELRSGLLSALLSGEHEIPATYDRLLGAA